MKKVIFVIVDALATRVVEPALSQGRLPHLRQLSEIGWIEKQCTAIFPSITPAATASLVTGCSPRQHGICGNYWYDMPRQEVAYYGDDLAMIWEEGFARYFQDFLVTLNEQRLGAPTAFERVAAAGRSSACLNLMWFHGPQRHDVNAPLMLELISGGAFTESVHGPEILYLGDFVTTTVKEGQLAGSGGFLKRYGFQDAATAEVLLQLADRGGLPDLTVAYFPDNDFESHKRGALETIDVLESVDDAIGRLIEALGGIDAFLDKYAIVITGDHSQSDLDQDSQTNQINLTEILSDFSTTTGASWPADAEWMICPNMRAAQLYSRHDHPDESAAVRDTLLECADVDQLIWRSRDQAGREQFEVRTRDRGCFTFRSTADGGTRDAFGGRWMWSGEPGALDARVSGGEFDFDTYPNALERIANCFCSSSGDLWVTAALGREFCLPSSRGNRRGSHGSLHALDSTSPLIVAGLPEELGRRPMMRSVDVLDLCLSGLEKLGPPRVPHRIHPAPVALDRLNSLEEERSSTCQPS